MEETIADIPEIDPFKDPDPDTGDLLQDYQFERDKSVVDLLIEIKFLLEDIKRNTSRQISPS